MKDKLRRFMYGRYGMDPLGHFLFFACVILLLLSRFTHKGLLYWIALALLIYEYVRMLSRNIQKRFSENQIYLSYRDKVKRFFAKQKHLMQLRKDYRIYSCPKCHQKVKIPKGRKKVEIHCPK